jgi:hypothetical protein
MGGSRQSISMFGNEAGTTITTDGKALISRVVRGKVGDNLCLERLDVNNFGELVGASDVVARWNDTESLGRAHLSGVSTAFAFLGLRLSDFSEMFACQGFAFCATRLLLA